MKPLLILAGVLAFCYPANVHNVDRVPPPFNVAKVDRALTGFFYSTVAEVTK